MTLPNFFIVGAAKAGTTSLHFYLRQHPEIFMSDPKEPSFFADWKGGIQTQQEYEVLFSIASKYKAIGEASTPYLFDSEAPHRIKALAPHARILILLRNPPEMAFSLWRMNRRNGPSGERLSFTEALQAEGGRMSDPEFRQRCLPWYYGNFFYFSRGRYYEQVKRYLDIFGPDQVRVFLFEEFRNGPLKVFRDVLDFLNVDPNFSPLLEKQNEGEEVHHRGLNKFLTRAWPKKGISRRIQRFLANLNRKKPPALDEELKQTLLEQYRPDIQKLSELLHRDLSLWS